MKKYEKPMVIIEDYSVSEFIAKNSCESRVNFREGMGGCTFNYSGINLFTNSLSECAFSVDQNDAFNGVCYHGPSGSNNFFSS
jgi:hypothetical protein